VPHAMRAKLTDTTAHWRQWIVGFRTLTHTNRLAAHACDALAARSERPHIA